jgi:hypothetical protein
MLGISEFENALMVLDLLGSSGSDLIVLDVFDSLKALPLNTVLNSSMENNLVNSAAGVAVSKMGQKLATIAEHAAHAAAHAATDAAIHAVVALNDTLGDPNAEPTDPTSIVISKHRSSVTSQNSKTNKAIAALPAAPAKKLTGAEMAAKHTEDLLNSCNNAAMGMDYSAFCEGIQMLGVPSGLDDELLKEAFCFGASIKIRDLDTKYMNISEFRKGWLKIADISEEMVKRGKILQCVLLGVLTHPHFLGSQE